MGVSGWRLHIGPQQTEVVGTKVTDKRLTLQVGGRQLSEQFFHHCPPTPDEMEMAIMRVEDEVVRLRHDITEGADLFGDDESLRELAVIAGLQPAPALSLSLGAVELTFDRLARVITGRPASFEGIPADNAFAARLLILREFMHHLQFDRITVTGGATPV